MYVNHIFIWRTPEGKARGDTYGRQTRRLNLFCHNSLLENCEETQFQFKTKSVSFSLTLVSFLSQGTLQY